ncbi:BLUF domain-containing protein [Methylobacterium cerastii]|nr:BLUF domain-containing protein [Methylobacterium cerastii]
MKGFNSGASRGISFARKRRTRRMPLSQIVFFSRNQIRLAGGSMREMVKDILTACNRYDRVSGLTGALVFNDHFFLQAMEGERAAISEQLWKLAADNRHSGMVLMSSRPIEQRDFEGWMVGFAGHSDALDAIYMDYGATPKLDPSAMPVQSAIKLLRAFAHLDGGHFVQKSGAGPIVPKDPARRGA